MTPRTGRPPTGNARGKVLAVRFGDDELAIITEAATKAADGGKPNVSEYVRDAAVAKAKRGQHRSE